MKHDKAEAELDRETASRPRYTAVSVRAGRDWAIQVPQVPGAVSRVRRLEHVESEVRAALAPLLGLAEDAFDIVVQPLLPVELEETIVHAQHMRDEAERTQAAAVEAARRTARELREELDLPMRDVGWLVGLSHQRIAQLLAEPDLRVGSGPNEAA